MYKPRTELESGASIPKARKLAADFWDGLTNEPRLIEILIKSNFYNEEGTRWVVVPIDPMGLLNILQQS